MPRVAETTPPPTTTNSTLLVTSNGNAQPFASHTDATEEKKKKKLIISNSSSCNAIGGSDASARQAHKFNLPLSVSQQPAAMQQLRCYLCETPKAEYSLIRSFSEIICRGCLNYEGPDRVELLIAEARQLKVLSSPSGTTTTTTTTTTGNASNKSLATNQPPPRLSEHQVDLQQIQQQQVAKRQRRAQSPENAAETRPPLQRNGKLPQPPRPEAPQTNNEAANRSPEGRSQSPVAAPPSNLPQPPPQQQQRRQLQAALTAPPPNSKQQVHLVPHQQHLQSVAAAYSQAAAQFGLHPAPYLAAGGGDQFGGTGKGGGTAAAAAGHHQLTSFDLARFNAFAAAASQNGPLSPQMAGTFYYTRPSGGAPPTGPRQPRQQLVASKAQPPPPAYQTLEMGAYVQQQSAAAAAAAAAAYCAGQCCHAPFGHPNPQHMWAAGMHEKFGIVGNPLGGFELAPISTASGQVDSDEPLNNIRRLAEGDMSSAAALHAAFAAEAANAAAAAGSGSPQLRSKSTSPASEQEGVSRRDSTAYGQHESNGGGGGDGKASPILVSLTDGAEKSPETTQTDGNRRRSPQTRRPTGAKEVATCRHNQLLQQPPPPYWPQAHRPPDELARRLQQDSVYQRQADPYSPVAPLQQLQPQNQAAPSSQQPPCAASQQQQAAPQSSSPIECKMCGERLEDRHFVQCPTNSLHKFCFGCSKKSIERQQAENKALKVGHDKVFCPSGKKCFLATDPTPWTFMTSEIETIFRESTRLMAVPTTGNGNKSAGNHQTGNKQSTTSTSGNTNNKSNHNCEDSGRKRQVHGTSQQQNKSHTRPHNPNSLVASAQQQQQDPKDSTRKSCPNSSTAAATTATNRGATSSTTPSTPTGASSSAAAANSQTAQSSLSWQVKG